MRRSRYPKYIVFVIIKNCDSKSNIKVVKSSVSKVKPSEVNFYIPYNQDICPFKISPTHSYIDQENTSNLSFHQQNCRRSPPKIVQAHALQELHILNNVTGNSLLHAFHKLCVLISVLENSSVYVIQELHT